MVPEGFHDFFLGVAGVAGALIGLLFVAISVNPGGIGESTAASVRNRPAAALSAFVNPLLVALVALLPDTDVGTAFVVLSAIGAATMVALMVYAFAALREDGLRASLRTGLSLLLQLGTYVVQLVMALRLQHDPNSRGAVYVVALTLLVLFSTGIDRAWEYVGAKNISLVTSVAETIRHVGHGSDDEPEAPSSAPRDVPKHATPG